MIGGSVGYFVSEERNNTRMADFRAVTQSNISAQQTVLETLSQKLERAGADEVVQKIIPDCPHAEQIRFDTLLDKLDDGLQTTQLEELERLLYRCGENFAQRKAVMAMRLEREVSIYQQFLEQSEELSLSGIEDFRKRFTLYERLAEEERKQSSYFSDLVLYQGDIIRSLIAGSAPDSEAITSILTNVSDTRDLISVSQIESASLRRELTAL